MLFPKACRHLSVCLQADEGFVTEEGIAGSRLANGEHGGAPAQIAATALQPGMSRKARTIAPASWPLFAPGGTCKSTTG
jgi:hypothetical protein